MHSFPFMQSSKWNNTLPYNQVDWGEGSFQFSLSFFFVNETSINRFHLPGKDFGKDRFGIRIFIGRQDWAVFFGIGR